MKRKFCLILLAAFPAPTVMLRAVTPPEEIAVQAPTALAILDGWHRQDPVPGERTIHLVYWTPLDREPAPRYRERLSALFEETRAFFAREMERNGLGPRTIKLVKEPDGLCRVHLVKGAEPYASYARDSGRKIRSECVPVLQAAGLDPEKETIVLFCNMANWDETKRVMSQNSPYYASGSHRSGTAWQVDSPLLDFSLIREQGPKLMDGEYGLISPGRYNSIFIGGVIHELGHALGLPHNRERPDQRKLWGTALMGSGNRTFAEDLRGEGPGTFLTLGEALRLASHPVFSGSVKGFDAKASATLREVKLAQGEGGKTFTFSARVTADPPAYAVIGYADPAGGSNYDATTATAVPDKDGRFTLELNALQPGKGALLHVVVAQANGAMSSYSSFGGEPRYPYFVESDGRVDLTASWAKERLSALSGAVARGQWPEAEKALGALEQSGTDEKLLEAGRALLKSLRPTPEPSPDEAEGGFCMLSDAAAVEAKVGYGPVVFNRLPEDEPLLLAGGRLFSRGLYAHAPAKHVWTLGGKWSRLAGTAAMAQGHGGTVEMSIVADGKTVWKSPRLGDGGAEPFDISVAEVRRLELIVSDAGDGNRADWGLWLEPTLSR